MESLVNIKNVCEDDFAVEFEVLPSTEKNKRVAEKRKTIEEGLEGVEAELEVIDKRVEELNMGIDRLTSHADGIDYMVAVGSGIIAGVIDILFVNDFSLKEANEWGKDKTNQFVISIAQKQGYKGDDIKGAILYLAENKEHKGKEKSGFHLASDSNTADFGGGTQHHLRDFSHHPTPVGLIFSMLTQFTGKAYGTDTQGKILIVEVGKKEFIGKDLPHKLLYGVVFWGFHMISDMAGSGHTISGGTGLPGPIVSMLKEISILPFFRNIKIEDVEFSRWISKLFNGTLLGERDENGKLIPLKFDLRTEIGVGNQLGQQVLPVIVNECIVRGFYFIRRFFMELKANDVRSIKDLSKINWKNTLPFKNRTVIRMLTVSTGTMTAIDLADAAIGSAIKSGGVTNPLFIHNMIVKVNFVGIGRFAIAVGSDISMGVKRIKARNEKSQLMSDVIRLSNTKLYYKTADFLCSYSNMYGNHANMFEMQANVWVEVEKTHKAIEELYTCMEQTGRFYLKTIDEMDKSLNEIEQLLPEVEKMNPGLIGQMLGRLER